MEIKTQGDDPESDENPAKRRKLQPSNKKKVKSLNSTSFCNAFSSKGVRCKGEPDINGLNYCRNHVYLEHGSVYIQCKGINMNFRRCKKIASFTDGFCEEHRDAVLNPFKGNRTEEKVLKDKKRKAKNKKKRIRGQKKNKANLMEVDAESEPPLTQPEEYLTD